jgi:hypothetical protein
MVCGGESVEDINFFGEPHIGWLKNFLSLPNGIPSAAAILRVLARIDNKKFEECLLSWTRGYFQEWVQPGSVIARLVITHWGIENKLHWTLDVVFREKYARNRKDHSAANLAVLRKITLNLIRLEPTEKYRTQKRSRNRKLLYVSYGPDFLLKILLSL